MPTIRVQFMEVSNQSTFDGTVFVVKAGSLAYEVGPTVVGDVHQWDLSKIQGLNLGDEAKVVTKQGTSHTCGVVITYETHPPNEAQYLVHGNVRDPKIDYQAITHPEPGNDELPAA
ncbi:hypothetical protein BDN71DRAFT_1510132 [Pleurotus eryngii]|uniref:Uncharacterized protein n=1 Tax=Pleurotus eryngii TaxID=5323 RepID=A0A9P5ZTS5_PLEER|nr:hypothetical protein BDN71DRAFT_1510132 [Pleurotus eryngii]